MSTDVDDFTDEQLDIQREFMEATAPEKPVPFPASEETGIVIGVPAEIYHRRQLNTVSKSALDLVERSPAHYWAWINGLERRETPALKFGHAWHMAILEPQRFSEAYAVAPKFSGKGMKARKEAWLMENADKLSLSEDDERDILGMLESVMCHPAASRLVLEGVSEVTLRWKDPITGLACKSRADYWVKSKRFAVDLKSTEDASEDAFARSVYKWGYHKQDALYRAGFLACGEPINHFAIIAIEKEPPYAVAVYTLDEDAVTKGYEAARRDISRLDECIKANHFPSYSDGVRSLSLPHWAA